MRTERLHAAAAAGVRAGASRGSSERARAIGVYCFVCRDANGRVKWRARAKNLVTDVGAKHLLDNYLAASAFTAATYLGLKGSGSAVVGDTQASHAGWSEVGGTNAPAYTGSRKTVSWGSASGTGAGSRSKASSGTMTFSFTSGGTVDGAFLNVNGSATVDNTTGTLFSAGTFSGGSKTVASSDTLTVTYTLSI